MRFSRFILFICCLFALTPYPTYAIVETGNATATPAAAVVIQKDKKAERFYKRLNKLNRKGDFDFSHPTKKWLWLAILLAIIAIVLQVIRNTGALSSVLWAVAGVCLIIWLLKIAGVL